MLNILIDDIVFILYMISILCFDMALYLNAKNTAVLGLVYVSSSCALVALVGYIIYMIKK
jgi:hypothetical protein